jgi:uncharacterized protein
MSVQQRGGHRMQLVSGKSYWPADPRAEEVDIDDIAHALGMICRFGGQSRRFYSVAEHSVNVSHCVPPEHALQALLHDAPEAYIGDVIRPVKSMLGAAYTDMESLNWCAIADRFGVPREMHPSIKAADDLVLELERRILKPQDPHPWEHTSTLPTTMEWPPRVDVLCERPSEAKMGFLRRFEELTTR